MHGAQTIALAPLSDTETTALLDELLGSDPSVAAMGRRSPDAPPVTRSSPRRSCASSPNAVCSKVSAVRYICDADVADVSVPATLQAAIAARIDRLDPDAKQHANAAAVIGLRFTRELLTALGIDPVLDELSAPNWSIRSGSPASAEYAFRHPLIRTVAYESQLKSDRAALHRRLAAAIETREADRSTRTPR